MKLAESFGALGLLARTPAELATALAKALASGSPAVIEVPITRGTDSSPWPFLHPNPPG